MKKTISFILSMCMIFTIMCSNVMAAKKDITVFIDNEQVIFDVQPQLVGGRTMVPLRAIFEELGATVQWDESTKTVTAYNEIKIVKATINSYEISINGKIQTMDVAPMIVDGRTLVPARFVAEAFDCNVEWDGDEMAVYITTYPIDYSKAEQDTKNNYDDTDDYNDDYYYDDYDDYNYVDYYYDAVVPFPTYDSVTGATYYDEFVYETNDVLRIYEYTSSEDYIYYIDYLIADGWEVYNTKSDSVDNSYTIYLTKGSTMISVIADLEYWETWIIYYR